MSEPFDSPDFDLPPDDVMAISLPPHSVEAEQSVLGGLLLENSAYFDGRRFLPPRASLCVSSYRPFD